jgi:hypothetical protein
VGYCLSVVLVDPQRVRAVHGSRDRRLMARILTGMQDGSDNWDEDPDSLLDEIVLRDIFDGTFSRPHRYSRYGWTWQGICMRLGRSLPVTHFAPCGTQFLEWLDEKLGPHGVPVKLAKLIAAPPMKLPRPGDWPCVGHWTAAEMRRLAGPLGRAGPRLRDERAAEAVAEVGGWLAAAARRPGHMLVGFYG